MLQYLFLLISLIPLTSYAELSVGDKVHYKLILTQDGISSFGSILRTMTLVDLDNKSLAYTETETIDGYTSTSQKKVKLDEFIIPYDNAFTDSFAQDVVSNCKDYGGVLLIQNQTAPLCKFSQFFKAQALHISVEVGPYPFGFYKTGFSEQARGLTYTMQFEKIEKANPERQ